MLFSPQRVPLPLTLPSARTVPCFFPSTFNSPARAARAASNPGAPCSCLIFLHVHPFIFPFWSAPWPPLCIALARCGRLTWPRPECRRRWPRSRQSWTAPTALTACRQRWRQRWGCLQGGGLWEMRGKERGTGQGWLSCALAVTFAGSLRNVYRSNAHLEPIHAPTSCYGFVMPCILYCSGL